jgi:hypothetical protein
MERLVRESDFVLVICMDFIFTERKNGRRRARVME